MHDDALTLRGKVEELENSKSEWGRESLALRGRVEELEQERLQLQMDLLEVNTHRNEHNEFGQMPVMKNKKVQAPCTYTSLRLGNDSRFKPLGCGDHGAWSEGCQRCQGVSFTALLRRHLGPLAS